jgi:hypothetical protein
MTPARALVKRVQDSRVAELSVRLAMIVGASPPGEVSLRDVEP